MEISGHDESFLTVADVAETLKLNQQTVRNWIEQGSLPALRVGRRVRIKRSDFERLLEQSYTRAVGPPAVGGAPSAEDFWSGNPLTLAPSAEEFWGGTPIMLDESEPYAAADGAKSSDPERADDSAVAGNPAAAPADDAQ